MLSDHSTRKLRAKPSVEEVRALLAYDPETGEITWKVSRGGWGAGRVAGRVDEDGYRRIGLFGRQYHASHIAFVIKTGEWCPTQIDHEDTDRGNNRWSNLRPSTQSQNIANTGIRPNNTSGFKGVSFEKRTGLWRASIKVNQKSRWLGSFETPEMAHEAYKTEAMKAWGQFARFE